MDTASFWFLVFGLAAVLVSNISRSPIWRSGVLMSASIVFLGLLARNPHVLLPLAGFLLVGYAGLVALERGWFKSSGWIILAVISAYMWLKKYTFLPDIVLMDHPYFILGLSYIFFRVLHLLIETADGAKKRPVGLGDYLLYNLNFTTLVSGPIQRYEDFARDQFAGEPIELGLGVVGLQIERIVRGFFKVSVVGVLLLNLHQDVLAQMYSPFPLMVRLFAAFRLIAVYPLFLYSNFSGYIDIVIALARLMRVRLPENFDRPFSASSVLEFWNRWHITLSNWLKTYVYNPLLLAMMRRTPSLALQPYFGVLCFFVTFFLIGVWHGRTSEFIFFGVLTGAGMSINKLWQLMLTRYLGRDGYKELATNPAYESFGRGLNFAWFAFTLFWFWSNWKQIGTVYSALSVTQWLGVWMSACLAATVALESWEWLRAALLSIETSEGPLFTSYPARVVYATALGVIAVFVTILLNQPAPSIVYKTF